MWMTHHWAGERHTHTHTLSHTHTEPWLARPRRSSPSSTKYACSAAASSKDLGTKIPKEGAARSILCGYACVRACVCVCVCVQVSTGVCVSCA